MNGRDAHVAALSIALFLGLFAWLGKREVEGIRRFDREHPYTVLSRRLARVPDREWCDDHEEKMRGYVAKVVDQFSDEIRALWAQRGGGGAPKFALLDLGPVQLRVNPKAAPGEGFDSSSWSWDEAYGLIARNRADPESKENVDRWRDLDSMARYLMEKDVSRLLYHRKFLSPEETEHQFRPDPSVVRSGEREFTVKLDPGEFRSHQAALASIFESEWRGGGYRVRVEWVSGGAYRIVWHSDSNRSFVNHRLHVLDISNLAWTKTVAHELGHVLGFDDHYYNVWNPRNCYYSQMSRLGDLMSNSEHGAVTGRHWQILDEAYPWKAPAKTDPFRYTYGK